MNIKVDTSLVYDRMDDKYQSTLKHHAPGLFGKLNTWLQARKQYRADRAVLKELLLFSDTHLKDIGISHADVIWAIKLPKEKIATLELQKLARSKPSPK